VYLRDPPPANILAIEDYSPVGLVVTAANSVIPTIVLHDEVMESCSRDDGNVVDEFVETSLKKNKKKKKNNKYLHDKTINEYIEHVKNSNILEEYKEKSGLNKMKSNNSSSFSSENVALNIAFRNERAMPMTPNDVLKQYSIGKPTEDSLWYRCPKTWTSDMVTYYTKIQKSKRNFDCGEELRKIRGTYLST